MKTVRMKLDFSKPTSLSMGRVNAALLDATTEHDLTRQQRADDADAMLDAAKFAKRVRIRLGLTQQEFSRLIEVPLDTIRNWEQGKRCPTGAAKALLKLLDRSPETGLLALPCPERDCVIKAHLEKVIQPAAA